MTRLTTSLGPIALILYLISCYSGCQPVDDATRRQAMKRAMGDSPDVADPQDDESEKLVSADPVDAADRSQVDLVNDVDATTTNKSAAQLLTEQQAAKRVDEMKSKLRAFARQMFDSAVRSVVGDVVHKANESTFKVELIDGTQMTVCGAYDKSQRLQKIMVFETGRTFFMD